MAKRQSELTIKLRLFHMRALERSHKDLFKVTPVQLDRYLAQHPQWSAEYCGSVIASFRSFYRWAVMAKKVRTNPAEYLQKPRIDEKEAVVIPDAVIEAALERCTLDEAAMLLLGRQCGLRRSEIAGLKLSDRTSRQLMVLGKGGKTRFVSVGGDLLDCLEAMERLDPDRKYYFPGRYGGHVTGEHIRHHVLTLTGYNPHSLRHAAGTAFYERTKDLRLTQEFLGHSSSRTTERYTHVSRAALIEATEMAGVRSIGRFKPTQQAA
ncbi:tyrosine-type recombinase/integrase [Subtercola endophyticus]|uniref:tyrosine-type recombinase/integrase n=1 Tax=Subtercola endophyticus TaxID=2895559 RepID=UPI001E3E9BDC|nr:tyrosine-type recombinase/integrase [Subtercola endophyticus]UFS59456.1 tyrosine-type recombinase/integrase [Subtercola endophyticus]